MILQNHEYECRECVFNGKNWCMSGALVCNDVFLILSVVLFGFLDFLMIAIGINYAQLVIEGS